MTLKVKYSDFNQITRAKTADRPIGSETDIEDIVTVLLRPIFPAQKGIRLLGVALSSLEEAIEGPTEELQLALPLA